ncbi:MAG: hypothetical protein A3B30_02750 [Candidatus Komeilibacteria bacterium RIFCSPLOWO2_01_FULL_52_15]|uniref:DUF362 domain-containing protein n=2 Tax=Candidatus Komeiliibacteriota TaxID=1817908 RepID=A0A1G2BPD3_9BACT|nr:MAG: hypothetical protein A2677_02075 [Candidatus Komeilibacteria bacterium RIFCSPHIGHO2_01_FULL_52_14]OGY90656.1 MAG: hypothetical protein A3B30_02750 [Candidatus Komeilibacteria bacterium RIFCSPLOWO2_01_FULL_52_15]
MTLSNDNTVALVTGADNREMVRQALTLLGEPFQKLIRESKRIFIHPNLVTHFRKSATASAETVRGVLDHIALVRNDEVLIGDAGFHDTKKAFRKFEYDSLSRSANIRLFDLNDDQTVDSFAYTEDFKKRAIPFSKTVADADCNIIVVPAKMHAYTMVSLSIKTHIIGSQVVPKSPFGIYARWPWNHTGYRQFHMTLADVYVEHPAQLAIIDGTTAMEGNGPAMGHTLDLGWLIASLNPVAADALAAYLMGIKPEDVGYLYYLSQKGIGPIDVSGMRILGQSPERLKRELRKPSSYSVISRWK